MKNYEARKPSYFATPAVTLIRGLHVSLKEILVNGMEQRFAVHRQSAERFRWDVLSTSLSLSLERFLTELPNELLESTSSAKAPLEPMMATHTARLIMSNPIHLSALSTDPHGHYAKAYG